MSLVTYRPVKPIPHFSPLIGYIKDEYIIDKTPVQNGVPIALDSGKKMTIRMLTGMNTCSLPAWW
jgi:hypothetical protein